MLNGRGGGGGSFSMFYTIATVTYGIRFGKVAKPAPSRASIRCGVSNLRHRWETRHFTRYYVGVILDVH